MFSCIKKSDFGRQQYMQDATKMLVTYQGAELTLALFLFWDSEC
jgi:hypothetical protein